MDQREKSRALQREKFRAALRSNSLHAPAGIDVRQFNDPVALTTDWHYIKSGGTNIRLHRLVQPNPQRIEFRGIVLLPVSIALLVVVGLGIPLLRDPSWEFAVFVLAFDAVFVIACGAMIAFVLRPAVFDLRAGDFWIGWRKPGDDAARRKRSFCKIADIHALQLVEKVVRNGGSTGNLLTSYELNLVLRNSDRIHVLDTGSIRMLRKEAGQLSRMLGCKLWDATPPPKMADVWGYLILGAIVMVFMPSLTAMNVLPDDAKLMDLDVHAFVRELSANPLAWFCAVLSVFYCALAFRTWRKVRNATRSPRYES